MDYHITVPPMVHWADPIIEPFRAIATADRPVISTSRENREYMARHDLLDANELGVPLPKKEDDIKYHNEVVVPSIEAVTPDAKQAADLQKMGLDSPVD